MPRSGTGGYSLPAGNPVVTGTTISSTDFNNTMSDLATAMAGSIAADGQTQWQGAQDANNNRIKSLSAAANLTDAVNANDLQGGRLTYLTGVAGTNTLTASVALLAAYTAGETFRFLAVGANTGAVTLNVNSLGALAITKLGNAPLVAGDLIAGQAVTVTYDGTQFQLQSPTVPALSFNRIINPEMMVSQYGSVTLAASGGIYGGCDRYINSVTATTVSATSDQASSPVAGIGSSGLVQRMTVTTTGTTSLGWFQRIESKNTKDMNGKTVTFALRIYQATGGTASFTPGINKANAVDNFGSMTTVAAGAPVSVPSGVVTTVSMTVTLGANDADNGLQVGAVSAGNSAQTGAVFYTSDWWFDVGPYGPSGTAKTNYSTELLRCQRYFQKVCGVASGFAASTTAGLFAFQLPTEMRVAPSFTAIETSSGIAVGISTTSIAGTWTSSTLGTRSVSAVFTRGSGTFTSGDGILLNETTQPFSISAEL